MTIKQKLVLGGLLLATLPVMMALAVGGWVAGNSAHELLSEQAANQLVAVRDSKRMQIEDYFARIRAQIETFAEDRMIVDATRQFVGAFDQHIASEYLDHGWPVDSLDSAGENFVSTITPSVQCNSFRHTQ